MPIEHATISPDGDPSGWSGLGSAFVRSAFGDVLPVAGPVDVDADGVHGEAVEYGGGEGGVTEVTSPVAEGDVGCDGGGHVAVATVDDVVERVRGGGLIVTLLDLAEATSSMMSSSGLAHALRRFG